MLILYKGWGTDLFQGDSLIASLPTHIPRRPCPSAHYQHTNSSFLVPYPHPSSTVNCCRRINLSKYCCVICIQWMAIVNNCLKLFEIVLNMLVCKYSPSQSLLKVLLISYSFSINVLFPEVLCFNPICSSS